ncbi:SPOR domain-containing protein [Thiohalophilus sp.]|uniref:SPOR domain-containing protein n=1 Tax=Thiohalophilus sp. TaxID=3028392 RepID=UPI002ACE1EAE|nr:SPOR domain-containing protein [Thiohalophilus sp.]MDZ7661250.1 SPOR domain-containing protein [Thiohalophilus sp.]
MKWLIYLLLLVNISLFAWHYRGGLTTAEPDAALPTDVQRLVLLHEKQQQAEEGRAWCYSLGPLKEPPQAEALSKRLQQWEMTSWRRTSQEAGRKGYWVLLPPLSSRVEARAAVAELKAKKIEDYFLIATGPNANGVSLGVFSTFEAAHRRINQLSELGFEPIWENVRLPIDEYWLDWPRETGSLSEAQLAQLQEGYAGLRQIERRCEPPAEIQTGSAKNRR